MIFFIFKTRFFKKNNRSCNIYWPKFIFSLSDETIVIYLDEMNANSDFNVSRENLSSVQKYNIASHIIGDTFLRNGLFEEGKIYADAGNTVFVMYNDFESNFDFTTLEVSCCGAQHSSELMYSVQKTPLIHQEYKPWEVKMHNFINNEYASILQTG
jgi:hypothetical protein